MGNGQIWNHKYILLSLIYLPLIIIIIIFTFIILIKFTKRVCTSEIEQNKQLDGEYRLKETTLVFQIVEVCRRDPKIQSSRIENGHYLRIPFHETE